MRKGYFILIGVLLLILIVPSVCATSSYGFLNHTSYNELTQGVITKSSTGANAITNVYIYDIENFENIVLLNSFHSKSDYTGVAYGPFTWTLSYGGNVIAYGTGSVIDISSTTFSIQLHFEYWNRGAITGDVTLIGSGLPSSVTWQAGGYSGGTTGMIFLSASGKQAPQQSSTVYYHSEFSNKYAFNDTSSIDGSGWLSIDRLSDSSTVNVTSGGSIVMSEYKTSGNSTILLWANPIHLDVAFSDGTHVSTDFNLDTPLEGYVTPTPTATPTPVPELCGYWALTVNTSNIKMNEYVLGSLTETDPSNRFDMIDWYRVLPNGQEHLALHYVYDPGLFGLGAGWFEVSPTGIATPSSEAQAKQNAIQIQEAGANYLRAKIYDDVSLLPMVYHDYDLVCTLNQIVYVGETTQATNQLGINTYEADTFSLLSGVSIGVYDYSSGGWQNKTSAYGETTYFNVIPGNAIRVLAQKTGWIPSDTNITVPSPPGIYPVYLKRPLVDVVNESYAFFNVRDSVTRTGLYQANIQLSDGQVQSTLPSGYAGFSVDDGVTYYYTVTKPGYQAYTGSFSISEDTTFPISLVQIAPTPTLTLPTTYPTYPTPTVSGTVTPGTTGTISPGTISPTGSATPFQTLSAEQRTEKTTKAMDFWIDNAETLGYVLFLAAIMGAFGLVMDSMGGNRRRRR